MRVFSYGEAMLRYAPAEAQEAWRGRPSAVLACTRSVGGDELNVCVALARLGEEATWVSVLPAGPLGEIVRGCAQEAGVRLGHVRTLEGAEMGTFCVLPDEGRVHYQRRHSAFCTQPPGLFRWPEILGGGGGAGPTWLHSTGITPLLGEQPAACWAEALRAAAAAGAAASLDLNYRPQLGTFAKLWGLVEAQLGGLHLLILSAHSCHALAEHLGLGVACEGGPPAKRSRVAAGAVSAEGEDAEGQLVPLLRAIHARLDGPAVACCLKQRDADGRQRRWSVLVDAGGLHSTGATPTLHSPKDECGGGSAWAAGVIDSLGRGLAALGRGQPERRGAAVALGEAAATRALRAGDVLAALSQETVGDHSTATRGDLDLITSRYQGVAAVVDGLPLDGAGASARGGPGRPAGASLGRGEAGQRVRGALARLESAKVIAILRAKHEARAVERAAELADLGYRAIEVTADSAGFAEGRLLPAVVRAVGDRCLVGIGTVTSLAQLEKAAAGGAHFALSPVRPTVGWGATGFVQACHDRGVLAMPAAFTPQEIYECVEGQGALTVKIFPAQLWSPSALQDLRRIGDFGQYRLCPSGGITCSTAEAWLAAGAAAVGMGSCLVGKDVAVSPEDTAALATAEQAWSSKAKPDAAALAGRLSLLTP